ncbi:MAG: 3-deoxy-D-manno-octulosonic acid transferase [Candidatus Binatia bacterium]
MLPVYNVLVLLLSPFLILYLLVFLYRRKDFRAGFWERLGLLPPVTVARKQADEPCFWIHAVSVGETMAALPLVHGVKARWPRCQVVFSTFTPAARAIIQTKCPQVSRVLYFPLDVLPIVAAVARRFQPDIFVLVETDLWPTWLYVLARKNVPAVLVNGRISRRRLWLRPFYREVLARFSFLCMQTEIDAERVIQLGIDPAHVTVTGNMKFALAALKHQDPEALRRELGLAEGARLLIAGSTHPGEEAEILHCYQQLRQRDKELFLLVAPRHPQRVQEVEDLFRARGLACARRSRARGYPTPPVLLLDTLGELSKVYALGTFIFVGGSLVRRGGHNILEPASWGKPIFFGPYMDNYSNIAGSLEREGAAIQVRSGSELAEQIERLSNHPARLAEMGRKAALFVAQNQGSLERNLEVIEGVLKQRSK